MKQWTPQAEMYDFGRPFPAPQVAALFRQFPEASEQTVFEPGCGTGRISLPLAKHFPGWKIFGIDSAAATLNVLEQRAAEQGLKNITCHNCLVGDFQTDNQFDLIIHSSLLHVIPNWQDVTKKLLVNLKDQGQFCLIGEASDLYSAVLGRQEKSDIDKNLSDFWRLYREERHKLSIPNSEATQVGCRWDLESSELAEFLKKQGYEEVLQNSVTWPEYFDLERLMKIIKVRCYSSMFMIEPELFQTLISNLEAALPELNFTKPTLSRHHAVARFFRRPQSKG